MSSSGHDNVIFGWTYSAPGPEFVRRAKNTFKETVWELQGRDCWGGEKSGMWDGRETDGHLHCEPSETDSQAWEKKCSNSPCKWHPERLVSQRTTLIPRLGLCGESLTPTYTVNGKVTFEKWGPHHDLIHWLTPGRGGLPSRRQCDLDRDYASVWIFSLPPSSFSHRQGVTCAHTHIRRNSISIWSGDEVGSGEHGGLTMCPARGFMSNIYCQTTKYSHRFHMSGVLNISMLPHWIIYGLLWMS